MCACRQIKSFLIEDILYDNAKSKASMKNTEHKQKKCATQVHNKCTSEKSYDVNANLIQRIEQPECGYKVNLEQRRNTYPVYPTILKPSLPWTNVRKNSTEFSGELNNSLSFYSDPMLNTRHMLRNQFAANRYMTHPYSIRAYGLNTTLPPWCHPWCNVGGRRKGGQVRFSTAQTGVLERRFNASKYLSPEERRALASSLRLSDRQVKTWFQNRRAKWRRTTPDSAGCDIEVSDVSVGG